MKTDVSNIKLYPLRFDYVFARPIFSIFAPMDCLTDQGIPLLEGTSRFARAGLYVRKLVSCPFSDSRKGTLLPMNIAALTEVVSNIKIIKEYNSIILSKYRSLFQDMDDMTYLDAWRVIRIIQRIPYYFAIQKKIRSPEDIEIPSWMAGYFKYSRGIAEALESFIYYGGDPNAKFNVDELNKFTQANLLLIGGEEVCPASPALIVKTLRELQDDFDAKLTSHRETIADIKIDGLFRFAMISELFERAAFLYEVIRCKSHMQASDQAPSKREISRQTMFLSTLAYDVATETARNAGVITNRVFSLGWPMDILTESLSTMSDEEMRMHTFFTAVLSREMQITDLFEIIESENMWLQFRGYIRHLFEIGNSELHAIYGHAEFPHLAELDIDKFFGQISST